MERNDKINNTAITNNSTSQLKPNLISGNQAFNNSLINQLNIPKSEINNEEALSTNANINQEEEKNMDINSIKNNNAYIVPKSTTTFTEKLKQSDTNTALNSFQYKNKLQQYLHSGHKKYPHAKKNRYLIQHYKHWEGHNYFPYSGHIIEGPCSFRPTFATHRTHIHIRRSCKPTPN